MDFAIIKIQGHQEIVYPNTQQLIVDRIEEKEKSVIKPEVLLTSLNGDIQIGLPTVNFPIELEVVSHQKGKKIYVQKFHAKARFRRRTGFRANQTVLKVVKFGTISYETKKINITKKLSDKKASVAKSNVESEVKKTVAKKTLKAQKSLKKTSKSAK